ncbi:MAG TPA: hypothetical protein VGF13_16190 [Verrucomicrobiae bacterium]|jgi:hypothetical protein
MKTPAESDPQHRTKKISGSANSAPGTPVTHALPATGARPFSRRNQTPSTLDALTPKQREQLLHWLIVEEIKYDAVLPRIRKEFGITIGRSSLWRWFHQNCIEREASPSGAPLVDITITAAAVALHIQVMPSGAVITTKGDSK